MNTVYEVANACIIKDLVFGWSLSVDGSRYVPLCEMDVEYLRKLQNIKWAPIIPDDFRNTIRQLIAHADRLGKEEQTFEKPIRRSNMSSTHFDVTYPNKEQMHGVLMQIAEEAIKKDGKVDLPYARVSKSDKYEHYNLYRLDRGEQTFATRCATLEDAIKEICRRWW